MQRVPRHGQAATARNGMSGHGQVPDLGAGRGMVAIRAYSVFHVASVEALAGKLPGMQGDVTVRVVDIINGVAYLIPCTLQGARKLAEQLADVIDAIENTQTQGKE